MEKKSEVLVQAISKEKQSIRITKDGIFEVKVDSFLDVGSNKDHEKDVPREETTSSNTEDRDSRKTIQVYNEGVGRGQLYWLYHRK